MQFEHRESGLGEGAAEHLGVVRSVDTEARMSAVVERRGRRREREPCEDLGDSRDAARADLDAAVRPPARAIAERGDGVVGQLATAVHQDDPVRDRLDLLHDVAREQDRPLLGESPDQRAEVAELPRVEADGRFVEDEERRVAQQCRREPDPLAVALAQLPDEPPLDIAEIARVQCRADAPLDRRSVESEQSAAEPQVLPHPHLGVRRRRLGQVSDPGEGGPPLLGHPATHDPELSGVGRQHAGDHPDGGGLARPVGAEQPAHDPLRNVEVEVPDRGEPAVSSGDAASLDHRGWWIREPLVHASRGVAPGPPPRRAPRTADPEPSKPHAIATRSRRPEPPPR